MQLLLRDLAVARGERVLVQGLNLCVSAGNSLLLEGANGSGKTSLLRVIAGLLRPWQGEVVLEGSTDEDASVAEQSHFFGHADGVKGNLTIAENLRFWENYIGDGAGEGDLLEIFGLGDLGDVPAHFLSAGQKRKLGLLRLLAARRPVWLLDEPNVSLDENACNVLAGLMARHVAEGGILIVASHVDVGIAFDQTCRLGRPA